MIISCIVALGKNREIGYQNKLLWHIKEDWIHFKKTTMGHTLLMGRKTYESIGKPLPGRKTVILSKNHSQIDNLDCFSNLEEAIESIQASGETELFIAGGGEIYHQGISVADKLYLSEVDYSGPADTYFPKINHNDWQELSEKKFDSKENQLAWTLRILSRK